MDKKTATKFRIYKYLEEGMTFKDACISAGTSEASGHRWKNEDKSFKSQCEASIAKYKEKLIKCVNNGALKNANIALEVLRIRWPNEWNPTKKVQTFDPQAELKKMKELVYGRSESVRFVHFEAK